MSHIPSLKEQILTRCIHFTGVQNKVCSAGVAYDSVRDVKPRPYQWPCFKQGPMSGGAACAKCRFPTEKQAAKQTANIERSGALLSEAIHDIKKRIQRTGDIKGFIVCPNCDDILKYSFAESNGHVKAACGKCNLAFQE